MAFLFDRMKDACTGVVNFLLDVSAAAGEIPTDPNDDDYNDDGSMHNAKLSHGAHGVPVHKGEQQNGKEVGVEVPQLTEIVGDRQFKYEADKQISALVGQSKGEHQNGQEVAVLLRQLTERVGDKQLQDETDKKISVLDDHSKDISNALYEYNSEYPGLVAQRLKLDFLKKITNNFSSEKIIGKGGYATVYEGEDEDGRVIAVKKLVITSNVDSKQFENEARHLSTLTHQNIVKLEGYCYEEEIHVIQHEGRGIKAADIYMLLCFEHMRGGSLDKHLSDADCGLNWSQRYKIIEGICNGLHYLHEGKEGSPIIHRDLKPGNILLDDEMIPKIADFGISRLIGEDKTHTRTFAIIGTWVYLSPEFKQNGMISKKLDIYSLGLIIIEIISGKRIYCDNIETPNEEFIELLEKWRSRLQKEGSMEDNYSQLYACIILSMDCMDKDPQKRPTTEQIIDTLNKTKECQFRSGGSFHLPNTLALPSLETYDGDNSQYNSENQLEGATPLPIELSLQFLKDITKNFCSELEIGQGVSGVVYQGVHPCGEIIAVKRLQKTIRGGERQFRNTVGDLLALEHKNVAKLIGCCYGVEREAAACNRGSLHAYKQDNFLCYEYLRGESLDKFIYDKSRKLNWDMRLRIIKEICEGLHFLHVESGRDIIHLNLKPSSIILDDKMVPKIANSGLHRLFGQEHTPPQAQDISGRLVYMAPEYLYCGEEKLESDLYSLGLLIMEVVTGNRSCFNEDGLLPWHFIGNVRKDWTNTSHIKSAYPSLNTEGLNQVKCCIVIGLKCADIRPKERPRIGEVLSALGKEAQASCTKKVHQQKLEVVCGAQDEQLIQPGIEIISKTNFPQVLSVDVHPTEPWIMTSHHGGQILIWDYHRQAIQISVELSEESVYSAKFIEREQWLVAGDDDGDIYVYSYCTRQEVASFRGHHSRIESLAVHPSRPFIVSSSSHLIELWNWENNWECTHTFKEHSDRVTQITFNPVDTNSFASASLDHTIKIWNVSSPNSTITLSADGLQSLRYIINDIGQFLISDSQDGTTKIWDLDTHKCVQTFKGHANHLGSLYRHSDLTVLVSGSLDGTVCFLNPITYRTEKIIGLNLGAVYAFGYLTESKRIVVGCHRGIAIIEPDLL
ncbi:uncharacterized protein [Lolium perenne]|uniref:uncharacterized protein isoform X3 n=1 Tax=Lolium perenne TaxID=4522 RepID=UPI0021F55067|nr:uncharacterized protein LOC127320829 isoform X3 [Lolium perenne]